MPQPEPLLLLPSHGWLRPDYPTHRHETISFAHLRSGTFEFDRAACRYANQRFVVHEVSNPAIEIFIDQWRNFETTLMKRCNCVPAPFAKTRAGNLTIFTTRRFESLRLQLAQIIDDGEDACPHRFLRTAGKIEKRIEFVLAPFHRRHDSFRNLAVVLAGRWRRRNHCRLVPAPPNRHFGAAVLCARFPSVYHLINGGRIEAPVIALRQQGQIGRFGFELGAQGTAALAIGAVTSGAIFDVLWPSLIQIK